MLASFRKISNEIKSFNNQEDTTDREQENKDMLQDDNKEIDQAIVTNNSNNVTFTQTEEISPIDEKEDPGAQSQAA